MLKLALPKLSLKGRSIERSSIVYSLLMSVYIVISISLFTMGANYLRVTLNRALSLDSTITDSGQTRINMADLSLVLKKISGE